MTTTTTGFYDPKTGLCVSARNPNSISSTYRTGLLCVNIQNPSDVSSTTDARAKNLNTIEKYKNGDTDGDSFNYLKVRIASELYQSFNPVRIIYNDPATIVFWSDGTKTVVKRLKSEEPYNEYHAFCAALAKKIYGNNSKVRKLVHSGEHPKPKKEKKKMKNIRKVK